MKPFYSLDEADYLDRSTMQFHIAILSVMAFIALARYSLDAVQLDQTFPRPLPPIQRIVHADGNAAKAMLYAFNVRDYGRR